MLPTLDTHETWAAALADATALRAGVDVICARYGLGGEAIRRYATGTLPVYALGTERVLKLFPPRYGPHALVEEQALAATHGRLPVPTPAVLACGELDGWRYVLMTQLEGRLLSDAWPEVPVADRDRFATELGETLAALHATDVSKLDRLHHDWPAFLEQQRASAVARQRAHGLTEHWLEQIPHFLERWMPATNGRRVLLHTEVMREHLLVAPRDDHWALTGLFDFEPAMVGAPEYDFASYGLFVAARDIHFFGRTLRAYGRSDAIRDEAFPRRILAYTLLHRYSNLRWFLERLPPPRGCRDLDSLANAWFTADGDG